MHPTATGTPHNLCSCGNREPHVTARRATLDGKTVEIWSDGAITGRMGLGLFGDRPRDPGNLPRYRRAADLLKEEVCLYEMSELRKLVLVARRAISQLSLQPMDYLRRVMAGERFTANGQVVRARSATDPRGHHASCVCRTCGPAYQPGWMPGPIKYRS